jgi:hypothetical protein
LKKRKSKEREAERKGKDWGSEAVFIQSKKACYEAAIRAQQLPAIKSLETENNILDWWLELDSTE